MVPTLDVAALSATDVGICPLVMPCVSLSSSTPMMYSHALVGGLWDIAICGDLLGSCSLT